MAKTKVENDKLTMETTIKATLDLKTKYALLETRVRNALNTIHSDKPERERLAAEFEAAVSTGNAKALDTIVKDAKGLFPAREKACASIDKLEIEFSELETIRTGLVEKAGELFDARNQQFRATLVEIGPGRELNVRQELLDEAATILNKVSHPGIVPPDLKKSLDHLRHIVEQPTEALQTL